MILEVWGILDLTFSEFKLNAKVLLIADKKASYSVSYPDIILLPNLFDIIAPFSNYQVSIATNESRSFIPRLFSVLNPSPYCTPIFFPITLALATILSRNAEVEI